MQFEIVERSRVKCDRFSRGLNKTKPFYDFLKECNHSPDAVVAFAWSDNLYADEIRFADALVDAGYQLVNPSGCQKTYTARTAPKLPRVPAGVCYGKSPDGLVFYVGVTATPFFLDGVLIQSRHDRLGSSLPRTRETRLDVVQGPVDARGSGDCPAGPDGRLDGLQRVPS